MSGEIEALKAAGMYRDDGGRACVERHGHTPDEPCSMSCPGSPARLGGNGGWISPPPVTPCPVMGEAYVDDPAYDMCVCGRRHITITCYGGGGPGTPG